jgi:cyclophilin family peptidyl-prolyl cis-trans isomerase
MAATKFLILLILIILISIGGYFLFIRDAEKEYMKKEIAIIQTNIGDIKLELFSDDAPKTVENFIKLAEKNFYDGTRFHRVIQGFMIQAGCPFSRDIALKDKWGTGGPGWTFEDEIHANNYNVVGTIAMANAGPDTNGSQFFINLADNNFLDAKHTVFGKIMEGMDIVEKIGKVATDGLDRPIDDVIIVNIEISDIIQ